jgi:ATP-dependent DNA helicase RecG
MTPQQLNEMLKQGETKDLDFVENSNEREAIARSVSALLNSDGGRVIVGVDSTGQVSGIRGDAIVEMQKIRTFLESAITPKAIWSMSAETMPDGKELIVIDVPTSPDKPYLSIGSIYLRRGHEVHPATAADLNKLIAKRAAAETRWERQQMVGLELEDLDVPEILRTAKLAESRGRRTFRNNNNAGSILGELSLSNDGQLTNAAFVLFGRDPARTYPQTRVRATVYRSDKAGTDLISDQLHEGHLFSVYERLSDFLQKSVDVSSEFVDQQWERSDKPEYPFWALREGIINALIHRDFSSISGGMSVGVYPHKIEIWSYGKLPAALKPEDLRKVHPSLPPNPDIAQVCFLRGLIDKLGRGTQKILTDCKRAGLKAPVWQTGPSGTTLTFYGKRSRQLQPRDLNQRQARVPQVFAVGRRFTASEYMKETGEEISERTARNDLSALVQAGMLQKSGKGKNTVYIRQTLGE